MATPLPDELEDLRVAIFAAFHHTGRAPEVATLAAELHTTESAIREGMESLAEQRHIVLRDGAIVMAHPFASIPLGFSVMGRQTLWWGGCCWDSFALAHLLPDEDEVLVASQCPGCGLAGAWVVNREEPPDGDWLAHFLVPVAHMWDDVVHTCSNQRLFCSARCIDVWCASHGFERGYVMDLATLWRLASHWYDGRFERGYVRREPAAAAEYFHSVGLVDRFWGTA